MSCCWRPVAQQQGVRRADGSLRPEPSGTGVVPLTSYPDCQQPHAGQHRAKTIYLVGWKTEHEKLFRNDEAKAAVVYSNSADKKLMVDRIPASQICDQAIVDLYP